MIALACSVARTEVLHTESCDMEACMYLEAVN